MHNCANDVLAYHDDGVTLPNPEREEMRRRRNTNRERVKKGLKAREEPSPLEFKSQGSYAMKTMVKHPEKDYDVDDGVYFAKEDLVGPRGAEMTALQVRQMVRDAVDDGSFKKAPEVRDNCVRVLYDEGYHVDLPSYRRFTTKDFLGRDTVHHELAGVEWKASDARDVTDWFEKENDAKSADKDNGRQLRRVTREIKKFARSRPGWKGQILCGFGVTKLVTECFRSDALREDVALHDTMKAIRDRLKYNLIVKHPVTPGDTITKGANDPKARFLCDKLADAVEWLAPLHAPRCTREEALKCWDKVYDTTYFSERLADDDDDGDGAGPKKGGGPSVLTAGLLRNVAASSSLPPVRKDGGGQYA
jgi:hypothetical protein